MKKIILFIVVLLNLIFTINANANWDDFSSVLYGAYGKSPMNVSVTFVNKHDNSEFTIDAENMFSNMSFSSSCNLDKEVDELYVSNNYDGPTSDTTCGVEVELLTGDIENHVKEYINDNNSYTGAHKQAILDSISYGLYDEFKVKLKLMMNSNGGDLPTYKKNFWSYDLKYDYNYHSGTTIPSNSDPECDDLEDNDGDDQIDFSDDPGCESELDTSEEDNTIENEHDIPEIGILKERTNVEDYTAISNSDDYIVMMADIDREDNKIPLAKMKVTKNGNNNAGDNVGIKSLNFTVMNLAGTTPLSDECVYSGSYNSAKYENDFISLYIDKSCTEVQKAGDYKISFTYLDEDGYSSAFEGEEYIYDLTVIPGNVDFSKTDKTYSGSNIKANGTDYYELIMEFKDKYDNLIKNRNVLSELKIVDNNYEINELNNKTGAVFLTGTTKTTDDNGKINDWKLGSYSNSGDYIEIKGYFNKFEASLDNSANYVSNLDPDYTQTVEKTDLDFIDIITNVYFSGDSNESLNQIVEDKKYKIKFSTTDELLSPTIKYIPKVLQNDSIEDITDEFDFTVSTGGLKSDTKSILYTGDNNITMGILNNGLSNTNNNNNNTLYNLKMRVEFKDGVTSPKVQLGGETFIKYKREGLMGEKDIVAKDELSEEIDLNYWGVYIQGMSSKSSKGLYELTRDGSLGEISSSGFGGSNKNKYFNDIKKNIVQITMGLQNTSSNLDTLNGKYKNEGDITLKGGDINNKSLVFAKGGNVYISGDIRKQSDDSILTILATKKDDGTKGKVIIDPSVTNIDAVIIAENGLFSFKSMNKVVDTVNGNKNAVLNNQLAIYGFVLSNNNTIGGSIKIDGDYTLPGGKITDDFYEAGKYDLNYLRRYHHNLNDGEEAENPKSSGDLATDFYGTFPIVIIADESIKQYGAYGF